MAEYCPLKSVTVVTAVTARRTTPANTVTAVTTDTHLPEMHFTPDEILSYISQNGTIDLRDVEEDMRKSRKEKILEKHPYSIYQGSDGRWRSHLPDESKKEGRRLIVKSSRDDLVDMICEHYVSHDKDLAKEACTLEDLYPLWIEYKRLHVVESTVIRVQKDWNRYYKDSPIIKRPITKLTKLELDTWVHEMIRKYNMGNHQYGNFSLIIRQMLEFAVDSEIVKSNAFLKVKVDKKRVLTPERKKADHTQVFNKTEELQIIRHAWDVYESGRNYVQRFVPLGIVFMFYTGLRVSELSALKFSVVDGNTLTVQRMLRYPTGEVIDGTKGTFGDRQVPLTPDAKAIISEIRTKREELGMGTDGYIFCPHEKPLNTYTAIQKAITTYCRELEIEEKSIHKVRKTMISTMIDGGLNLNTSRQIAGHMDERTTLNNYYYDRSDEVEKYNNFVRALA